MKTRLLLLPVLLAQVLLLSSCSHSIYVSRCNSTVKNGVTYSLPKTMLKITITYTVREITKTDDGIPTILNEVIIAKPIEVTPMTYADDNNSFELSGEDITKNIFLDGGFDLKMSESGILTSINSDVTDHTADAVQLIISAGIKIAEVAAMAKDTKIPPPLEKIVSRIKSVYTEFGNTLCEKEDTKKNEKLKQLSNELQASYDMIEKYYQKNQTAIKESDVKYTTILDPDDFQLNKGRGFYWYTLTPENIIAGKAASLLPGVTLKLFDDTVTHPRYRNVEINGRVKGIVYKRGKSLLTTVEVSQGLNTTEVIREYLPYPQYGMTLTVPVESKGASSSKTNATFSPSTGNLTEYSVNNGSSADKVIGTLNTSLDNVQKTITELKYDLKQQELEKQKALIDAEKELIEAKKELEKSKSGN
jgi:hypothetical protein